MLNIYFYVDNFKFILFVQLCIKATWLYSNIKFAKLILFFNKKGLFLTIHTRYILKNTKKTLWNVDLAKVSAVSLDSLADFVSTSICNLGF